MYTKKRISLYNSYRLHVDVDVDVVIGNLALLTLFLFSFFCDDFQVDYISQRTINTVLRVTSLLTRHNTITYISRLIN